MRNIVTPGRMALYLFIIPLLPLSLSFLIKFLMPYCFIMDGIIIAAMLLDIVLTPSYRKGLELTVSFPASLKINSLNGCKLSVKNSYRFPVNFHFLLDLDVSFKRDYCKDPVFVKPGCTIEHSFSIFPERRGEFKIGNIYLKGFSVFRLWTYYRTFEAGIRFKVTPSLASEPSSFKIIQTEIRKQEGKQDNIIYGDGTNFEMLRDYIKGDEYGKIDWKATARSGRPVTRVYRVEDTLDVAILLDCGRLMASEDKGMSLLDHSIRAALVIAYAAARNNDRVSLTAFGKDIIKYMPPTRDIKVIKKMNTLLSDIQYDFYESDYRTAFSFLQSKLDKRSLVVIFTDIVDDSGSKIYGKHLSMIRKNHMVLLVLLRDRTVFEAAEHDIETEKDIYYKAAGADMVIRRNATIALLKRLGVEVLDIYPGQVSAEVISSYFKMKRGR